MMTLRVLLGLNVIYEFNDMRGHGCSLEKLYKRVIVVHSFITAIINASTIS